MANSGSFIKTTLKPLALELLVFSFAGLLTVFSKTSAQAVYQAALMCLQSVGASLFPFMVLSNLIAKTGGFRFVTLPLLPVTRHLLKIPDCAVPAFIVSQTGGYPAGAIAIRSMYEDCLIDRQTAGRMLLFSHNAGPSFLIGVMGAGLLGSVRMGALLYCSQLLASLILGTALGLTAKPPPKDRTAKKSDDALPFSEAVCASVQSGASALITACAFIVFFAAVSALLGELGIIGFTGDLLARLGLFSGSGPAGGMFISSLLEIASGSAKLLGGSFPGKLIPLSFALSFGGVSVTFQVLSISNRLVKAGKYFLFRAIYAAVACLCTAVGSAFFGGSASAGASFSPAFQASGAGSLFTSLCLVCCCILYIATTDKNFR